VAPRSTRLFQCAYPFVCVIVNPSGGLDREGSHTLVVAWLAAERAATSDARGEAVHVLIGRGEHANALARDAVTTFLPIALGHGTPACSWTIRSKRSGKV
jgi:hypothetical protein